jgi:hypothetical protein
MKKVFFAVLIGLIFCGGITLSAKESEFYYHSVDIEKIYQYRSGYVVLYRQGVNKLVRAYIPHEWFNGGAGKADMVFQEPGRTWPHLSVYYKSGEFSHVRLYVRKAKTHETWGLVPNTVNLDEYFEGVEEIKLVF